MTNRATVVASIVLCLGLLAFAAGTDHVPLTPEKLRDRGVAENVSELLVPQVIVVPNLSWPGDDHSFGSAHRRIALKISNTTGESITARLELFDESGTAMFPIKIPSQQRLDEGTGATSIFAFDKSFKVNGSELTVDIAPKNTVMFLLEQATIKKEGVKRVNAHFGYATIENVSRRVGLVAAASGFGGLQKAEGNDLYPTTVLLNGGRPF